ncbi:MAG: hypothetical protein LBD06_02540 [Candidatus Accumulibacter sp.]|nr:hypothetical protein [Accumulibacter sp.]
MSDAQCGQHKLYALRRIVSEGEKTGLKSAGDIIFAETFEQTAVVGSF